MVWAIQQISDFCSDSYLSYFFQAFYFKYDWHVIN